MSDVVIPECVTGQLGDGADTRVLLVDRGATRVIAELNPTTGYFTRDLDATSDLQITGTTTGLLGESCCDGWDEVYPWATEVIVYRDGRDAWSGPVTDVEFGYGRTRAGRVANGVGFDMYKLRTADAPWFGGGLEIRKTGQRYPLSLSARQLIRIPAFESPHGDKFKAFADPLFYFLFLFLLYSYIIIRHIINIYIFICLNKIHEKERICVNKPDQIVYIDFFEKKRCARI